MRSHLTAGQDGFRGGSSTQNGDVFYATGLHGVSPNSDRSDPPPARRLARPELGVRRDDALLSGCRQGAPDRRLAADHELPGDARRLVGERDGGELGRLALESSTSQGEWLVRPRLTCWMTEVAPATSTLRSVSSPARVMPPSRCLPAVE